MEIIVALTHNGGIGLNGSLPWNISEELKHFKKLTKDSCVVMGRKTWDSLPQKYKPLPERQNIILSTRTFDVPNGVEIISNLSELSFNKKIFFIGGEQIYRYVLSSSFKIDLIHVSLIKKHYDADKFFPLEYLQNNFNLCSTIEYDEFYYLKFKQLK